ncbi:MAG TPA: phosphatase PAP2 family protein [Prolixibacteraceae bacterium]|jgi:undecaprenyl-diphosphatase
MEFLQSIDKDLFLFLNGMHNAFFDSFMYWMSDRFVWVPMYVGIILLLVWRYKMRGVWMVLFLVAAIALCDQTASHLLKNLVQRLRPSQEPSLAGLVRISKAGPGGLFGFASSHAANSSGLAIFLYFALDNRLKIMKYGLLIWAVLVSYSRIYNGVHYPGDVLAGWIIGLAYGYLMAKAYLIFDASRLKREKLQSNKVAK